MIRNSLIKVEPRNVGLFKTFDDVFDDFFPGFGKAAEPVSSGLMDVYEDDKNVYVELNAPDYEPENINIEVYGRKLTISGRQESIKENRRYKIQERQSSSFNRTVLLDEPLDSVNIIAELQNGLLKVTVPKAEKIESKKIEIQKK